MTGSPAKLRIDADCGNSPRKAQVRDLLIALSERRSGDVAAELSDDVEWDIVGSVVHRGRDDVTHAISGPPDRSLHIRNLLSHGKQVAAEGIATRRRTKWRTSLTW